MAGKKSRNEQVVGAFGKLGNKAQVGRMFGLSRERVGQIVAHELGARSPIVREAMWFDWELLHRVADAYGISVTQIADGAEISRETASRVLGGEAEYIKNVTCRSDAVGMLVVVSLLTLVRGRIKKQEAVTRDLIDEFYKVRRGYLED